MQQVGENIDAQAEDEHAKQVASSSDEEGDDVEEKTLYGVNGPFFPKICTIHKLPVAVEMDKPAHNWKDEEKASFVPNLYKKVLRYEQ